MLKEWLDDNLERLVERAVRRELRRISRDSEGY
jgi:cell pole-organizing protein PopZ